MSDVQGAPACSIVANTTTMCIYNMEIILPKKENEPGKELVIRS